MTTKMGCSHIVSTLFARGFGAIARPIGAIGRGFALARRPFGLLGPILLVVGMPSFAHGQTWNVGAQFSTTSNPNGVWSYGWANSLGSPLQLFTRPEAVGWFRINDNYYPDIISNSPSSVTAHIDDDGSPEPTVIRWTAPMGGFVRVFGSFFDLYNNGFADADVHILLNGVPVWNGVARPPSTYDLQMCVRTGDAIDFAIGIGANRLSDWDRIVVDATITAAISVTGPQPERSCQGGIATFQVAVTATGTGPFTYQWRKDSTPIDPLANPSAATATLTLTNVGPDDVASYDCIVTNACGSVTSNPATLTICIGEFNCDGGIDGADVDAFFADWESGNAAADVNADGGIDGADVSTFFEHWEAGC